MYVVLTKNSNNTWDAIADITLKEGTPSKTMLESAFDKNLPMIGMDATSHTTTALKGSIWDGSSFSGGTLPVGGSELPEDFFTLNKRYVFLCDNELVLSVVVPIGSSQSDMWAAAIAGETILIKTETGPRVKVGKTFNWDGTELSPVEPA
jgi:hypothetical protein